MPSATASLAARRAMLGLAITFGAGTAGAAAAPSTPPATLALHPVPRCVASPSVDVRIELSGAAVPVVGGQFFLQYDPAHLVFDSVQAGDPPFTVVIFQHADAGAGLVDLAVGVPGGAAGTSADTTMATVRFAVVSPGCALDDTVQFRPHEPPTRLTDAGGAAIDPELQATGRIIIDGAPLHACRVDLDVNGRIEPVDIAILVNRWFSSLSDHTLDGDFDGSGQVDPADIATFVNAWFAALSAGC